VTARPLRYPWDDLASKPEEKGIDVQIALDFVMMAVRGEYGVGVLMSGDTDLLPALEEVIRLGQPTAEVAAGGHQPVKDADSVSRPHASTVSGSTITPTPPSRTTPTTRHADRSRYVRSGRNGVVRRLLPAGCALAGDQERPGVFTAWAF